MTFSHKPPHPPTSPDQVRLDNIHPDPADQAGLRRDGINYLAHLLNITEAQAEELYDIVEARGRGVARYQIWREGLQAAIAGGYGDKMDFDIFARQFVDLFKGGHFTDPFPDKDSSIGRARI